MSCCNTTDLECRVSAMENNIAALYARTDDIANYLSHDAPLVIGYAADAGLAGVQQLDLFNTFQLWNPTAIIFGGDNNYENGDYSTLSANWATFDSYISGKRVYPAFGNHDYDNAGTKGQPQIDKFSYLPNNKRYYSVYYPNHNIEFFILNSGIDTGGALREPDGNSVDSVQYNWFVSKVHASKATRKIVVFHHPYVNTYSVGSNVAAMDWGFEGLGIDAVLNGHTHTGEHIKDGLLHIINCSATAKSKRTSTSTLHKSAPREMELQWHYLNYSNPGPWLALRIEIRRAYMSFGFWNTTTKQPIYTFTI